MVVKCGVTLSSTDVVLEYVRFGFVVDHFVDECVYVDCIEGLREIIEVSVDLCGGLFLLKPLMIGSSMECRSVVSEYFDLELC